MLNNNHINQAQNPISIFIKKLLFTDENVGEIAVFVFFLSLAIIFHMDKVLLGGYSSVRMEAALECVELIRSLYCGNRLLSYGFYSWAPDYCLGIPAYATHFAPYNLISMLGIVVPMWGLYSGIVITTMTLAGFGFYLFIKYFFCLPHWVAMLGGGLFALSSQVQPGLLYALIFCYAFPLFFVCSLCIGLEQKSAGNKQIWIYFFIVLFLSFVSFPTYTLQTYSVVQIMIILLFNYELKKKFTMIMATFLIWVGYAMIHLPNVVALIDMSKWYHRDYIYRINNSFGSSISTLSSSLINFFKKEFLMISFHDASYPFLICSTAMLFWSSRTRRCWALLLFFGILIFCSGSSRSFIPLWMARADLDHFIWVLPLGMNINTCIFLDEIFNKKIFGRFCIFLAAIGILFIIFRKNLKDLLFFIETKELISTFIRDRIFLNKSTFIFVICYGLLASKANN
jgi:hypothetical protein